MTAAISTSRLTKEKHTQAFRYTYKRVMGLSIVLILALVFGSLALPTGVWAASTISVNTLADDTNAGDALCTLREAINNANSDSDTTSGDCVAGSGDDTISFGVSGTISLSSSLVIQNNGKLTISPALSILSAPLSAGR